VTGEWTSAPRSGEIF